MAKDVLLTLDILAGAQCLQVHTDQIFDCAWNPCGVYVADCKIRIFILQKWENVHERPDRLAYAVHDSNYIARYFLHWFWYVSVEIRHLNTKINQIKWRRFWNHESHSIEKRFNKRKKKEQRNIVLALFVSFPTFFRIYFSLILSICASFDQFNFLKFMLQREDWLKVSLLITIDWYQFDRHFQTIQSFFYWILLDSKL